MSWLDKFIETRKGANGAEMSFVDHIEELRWHIIRSLIVLIVVSIVVFFNIEWIFDKVILGPAKPDFISYKWLCQLGQLLHVDVLCLGDMQMKFQNNQMSGQFMMSFSVSFMIGFILSFPFIFWELWKFIKPALKPSELKYARGIVFWCSLLFFTGVAFAYFIIAPFTINFFANYQLSPSFENIITIANYYDTMNDLILGMGIVFELPVIVFFLSRIGILTPKFMREKRRFAIVIILVLAAVITPPDWFSIWLVAIPLLILYEAGIFISARAIKEKENKYLSDIEKY
ncbi:MAG TPA: twin-arginine translocase subunit TatC [Flavipsychrobacter sp.]|nr:twin-arginine translocase subunit TatC [Flavipsychrobacter sp.]